eukprot:65640-Pyramimonas_sp.AAC.1
MMGIRPQFLPEQPQRRERTSIQTEWGRAELRLLQWGGQYFSCNKEVDLSHYYLPRPPPPQPPNDVTFSALELDPPGHASTCLFYTSDAADDTPCVDL